METRENNLNLSKKLRVFFIVAVVSFFITPAGVYSDNLPTGITSQIGTAAVSVDGNSMSVVTSDSKWWGNADSFNIGNGYALNSMGPNASAVMLYNVTGGSGSNIAGIWNSNCNQFLLNPNGILFSSTARVNVGSLIASTLTMSKEDFLAGNYVLGANGQLSVVTNAGNIIASNGGVVLAGGAVSNLGVIRADLGTVNLLAGEQVTLTIGGGGNIQAVVDEAILEEVYDQAGNRIDAGVENLGEIRADGGTVYMQAEAVNDVFSNLINQEGVVQAGSMVEKNGKIVLVSDSEGIIQNTGTLNVSGIEDGASGGEIEMTGYKVGQFGKAHADAKGDADGGTINIYAGDTVALSEDSLTTANAGTNGDGGEVIVFSPDTALFWPNAKIEAKGGSVSGDGGFVEVSGKEHVEIYGLVDTSALNGKNGMFLIDPINNVEIVAAGANGSWDGPSPYTWVPDNDDSTVDTAAITTNLGLGNVTITTVGDGGGGQNGVITVTNAIDLDGGNGHTLTLYADDGIIVNGQIYDSAGSDDAVNIVLDANNTSSLTGVDINASISTYGGSFTSTGAAFDNTGGTITTSGGTVTITHTGAVTVGADINAGAAAVNITLTTAEQTFTNNAAISGNAATIIADKMALSGGTINVGANTVTLESYTGGNAIDLGSTTNSAGSTLELADSELDTITATTLRVGATDAGAISITAALTPAGITNLSLLSDAGVSQGIGDTITVSGLRIDVDEAVTLNESNNDVDILAVEIGDVSVDFSFADSDDLTIGTVDGTSGIGMNGGDITVDAAGALTVTGGVQVITNGAPIYLEGSSVTIGTGGAGSETVTNGGAGVITISAANDDINLYHYAISANSGLLTLAAQTGEILAANATGTYEIDADGDVTMIAVGIGSDTNNVEITGDGGIGRTLTITSTAVNGEDIDITELTAQFNSIAITIGDADVDVDISLAGVDDEVDINGTADTLTLYSLDGQNNNRSFSVTLTEDAKTMALVSINAGEGSVTLDSAGPVTDAGGTEITAATAAITAVGGIGSTDALEIAVATLSLINNDVIDSTSAIQIINTGALTLNGAVNNDGGNIMIEANSPLTISSDVIATGSGNITLTAANSDAENDDLTINEEVEIVAELGSISLSAGDDILVQNDGTGILIKTSGDGEIDLTADADGGENGIIDLDGTGGLGATLLIHQAGTGNVDINANDDVTITRIVTSGGDVTIDAAGGDTPDIIFAGTGVGAIDAAGTVTVNADDSLTVNALIKSASTIALTHNVDNTAAAENMAINAQLRGTTITLADGIGGTGEVTINIDPNNVDGAIIFNNTSTGGVDLNANVTAAGDITFSANTPVDLDTGATVMSTTGNVSFGSTINGGQALTVSAVSGTATFTGVVGGTTEVSTLTVAADIASLNADIFSEGNVDFTGTDHVVLTSNVTIDSEADDDSDAGYIKFKPTSTTNGAYTLSLDAGTTSGNGGAIQLGTVGNSAPLASLTVDNDGSGTDGTTTLYGNITTSGDITMTNANDIDLANNVTLTTTDSAVDLGTGDNIDGAYVLAINAGTGTVTLGRIGATTDITGLLITCGALTSADMVEVDGALDVVASGAVDIDGAIDVDGENGDVSIVTSSTLALDAALTVDGSSSVTLSSGTSAMIIGTTGNSTVTAVDGDINIIAGDLTLGTGGYDGIIITSAGGGNIKIDSTGTLVLTDTDSDLSKIDSGGYLDIDPTDVTINAAGLEADEYIYIVASGTVTNNTAIVTTGVDSYVIIDSGSIVQSGDITTPTSGAEYVTLIADTAITDTNDSATDITTRTLNINDATTVGAAGAGNELDIDVAYLNMSDVSGAGYILEDDGIILSDLNVDGLLNIEATLGDIAVTSVITSNDNVTLNSIAGAITVGAIDAGTGGTVTLTAGTTINDASDDTVLDITAGTVDLNGTTGIGETNALEIAAAAITAENTTSGDIDIDNITGSDTTVSSLTTLEGGNIRFDQSGGGNVTFNTVTTAADGSPAEGEADITLTSDSGNLTIATAATAGGLGDIIYATTTSGDVILTGTTTAADDVTVDAAGSINGAGLITASTVDLDAVTGIGNSIPLALMATTITADNTTSGDVDIDNNLGTAVAVITLTTGFGGNITFDQSGGGDVTFYNVSTSADASPDDGEADITLRNLASNITIATSVSTTGQGDVILNADGPNSDLAVNGSITLVDGGATLTADDSISFAAAGDITASGAGNVSVQSNTAVTDGDDGDGITQVNGSVIDAGSGTITLVSTGTNAGNITVAGLNTTNATAGAVVISTAGGVIDGGDDDVDIVANTAGAVVDIDSATGVGNGNALETTVAGIEIDNSTNGNIEINETDGLLIRNITQALDGSIVVTTAGATTVVAGLGGVTANNIAADGDSISITVAGDSSLTVNDGVSVYNGTITLAADDDVIFGADGDVDSGVGGAGNVVTITADNDSEADGTGGAVTLADGTVIDAGSGTIDIGADENITLGRLVTTSALDTAVTLTSTSGGIRDAGDTDGADVDAASGRLVVDAVAGIGTSANALETTVSSVDLDNTLSGVINIAETDSLTVIQAVFSDPTGPDDGDITIVTTDGSLTIDGTVSTKLLGDISLDANGTVQDLTINAAVTAVDGAVTLAADDSIIFGAAGDITATGAGNVQVLANADNADSTAGGDVITMDDDTLIDAGSGTITLDNFGGGFGGTVTVGGLLTTSTSNTAITITTDANVADAGGTYVDAVAANGRLVVDAATGISLDTTVGSIDLDNSTSGVIDIDETDALSVIRAVQAEDDSITILAGTSMIIEAAGTGVIIEDTSGGSADADILLRAEAGSLTVNKEVRNDSGNADADIVLDADGATSSTAIAAAVSTAAGDITITADDDVTFTVDGDVTATGAGNVVITADNDSEANGIGGAITMADNQDPIAAAANSTVINAGSGLIVLSADEDITLGRLVTTHDVAGDIEVTITSAHGAVVDAGDSGNGAVNQPDIEVDTDNGTVSIKAYTGIGEDRDALPYTNANSIETKVRELAATTTTGDIYIENDGALRIIDADTLVAGQPIGVTVTSGSVYDNIIVTAGSPVTVDAVVSNTGGGDILLAAEGTTTGDDLTINAAITASGGNGNITLYAGDTISQNSAAVTAAGSGTITYHAGVDYNSGTPQAGLATGASDITMNSASTVVAGTGDITMTAPDSIQISSISTSGNVSLTADDSTYINSDSTGAITEALATEAANITALTATLRAATGIGSADDIDTNITTLDALNSTSGDMLITEIAAGEDLNVNQATQSALGNIIIQTEDGTLTVVADQSGVSSTTGTVTLIAGDSDSDHADDLVINDTVTTTTGNITLTSSGDDIRFGAGGDVTSTSGNVDVNAESGAGLGEGMITMADGAVINSGTGQIDMDAYGDITLGGLTTTYTADDAVAVTSVAGGIIDGGDTDVDIIANTASAIADLDAATGIGSDNALETSIYSLEAENTTSGNIKIAETDDINLVEVINSAVGGSVDITVGGTITATTVTSGGAVNLYATDGDILDTAGGLITAGAGSSLKASGIIGTALGPYNPVDVDINGDLWVWAGGEQNRVSVITQGRVVSTAKTERTEIFEPTPTGLVIHDNRLMGGGNYGSGSTKGSILSRGYGEMQAVIGNMYTPYYLRALQPWGYMITGIRFVTGANNISEGFLNEPWLIMDGSAVGIEELPTELLIVPEDFWTEGYFIKKYKI